MIHVQNSYCHSSTTPYKVLYDKEFRTFMCIFILYSYLFLKKLITI